MPDPHERSIASALKSVKQLKKLADRMRGRNSAIHQAYRTVLRALAGNTDNAAIVTDALATLEQSIRAAAATYYDDALAVGMAQAQRDLAIYGLGTPDNLDPNSANLAIASTIALLHSQAGQAHSISRLDLGEELIIGDDSRRGIIQPAPILLEMAFWLTSLSVLSYIAGTKKKMPGFVRQAVAQIDHSTTRTCLNVHGQIVDLDEDFHLTGTPRYADEMHAPPFHRGCRTAVATIRRDLVDSDVTADMRDDAVEQGKKPKPSTRKGKAHYKVVGKRVLEFRGGRWHRYKTYRTNIDARRAAARLNEARRS